MAMGTACPHSALFGALGRSSWSFLTLGGNESSGEEVARKSTKGKDLRRKSLPFLMVRLEGLEPTTRGLRIRCSTD